MRHNAFPPSFTHISYSTHCTLRPQAIHPRRTRPKEHRCARRQVARGEILLGCSCCYFMITILFLSLHRRNFGWISVYDLLCIWDTSCTIPRYSSFAVLFCCTGLFAYHYFIPPRKSDPARIFCQVVCETERNKAILCSYVQECPSLRFGLSRGARMQESTNARGKRTIVSSEI